MTEDKKIEQLIAHNVKSLTISQSKYNRLKQVTNYKQRKVREIKNRNKELNKVK